MKKINKNMMISEAISINPKVAELLLDKGVHCIGCGGLSFETLEMGLKVHGLSNKEIGALIKKMNVIKEVDFTKEAAKNIKEMLEKSYKYLRIKKDSSRLGLSLEKSKNKI